MLRRVGLGRGKHSARQYLLWGIKGAPRSNPKGNYMGKSQIRRRPFIPPEIE